MLISAIFRCLARLPLSWMQAAGAMLGWVVWWASSSYRRQFRDNLDAAGVAGVRLVWGDGRLGHAPNGPYDTIVSAAGGEELPAAWVEQLAPGGRLVAPLHSPADGGQVLVVLDRTASGLRRSVHDAVHFVPLKSGTA